jgi:hypothetical protein
MEAKTIADVRMILELNIDMRASFVMGDELLLPNPAHIAS